jgi:hypothetical protein
MNAIMGSTEMETMAGVVPARKDAEIQGADPVRTLTLKGCLSGLEVMVRVCFWSGRAVSPARHTKDRLLGVTWTVWAHNTKAEATAKAASLLQRTACLIASRF